MSFTVSAMLLLRVAFHQLSKTTSSVGYIKPSDFMRKLLSGVKMDEPYTAACLLNRQNLGLALLRSIEDKARSIQISVGAAHSRLWREIKEEGSK